jgi:hypothetical protein
MSNLFQRLASRVAAILVCLLVINSGLYSQGPPPYAPTIIPPSPNAASLGKFGDIPVSPYTGTTDVSIPIYTVQAKGISVPVTLSYHTGGIRLSEESGWVGLGWALQAGGMISRTVNDKDDFTGGYYNSDLVTPVPEVKGKLVPHIPYQNSIAMGTWGYHFLCRYFVYTEFGKTDFFNSFKNVFASPASYDLEPDTYSFNFLGRSGKFIIGRDKKVVLQKQENLKIQFASDASFFIITDEQGNNYIFQDKEYSQPAIGGTQHISSWLLSKIVTQQKDSVLFNYYSDATFTTIKGDNSETIRIGVAGNEGTIYSNDPGTSYSNKTLQTIDYSNAQLQFTFDAYRADMQGGKKLNNVKVYSKDQFGTLKYIKEHQLYYSYFNSTSTDSLEFKRLRLDSVREASGSSNLPPYSFSYNMPANGLNFCGKHYASVDHWGYFNGSGNNFSGDNTKGFTPPITGLFTVGPPASVHQQYLSLSGSNREPDAGYMQIFSLNKVNYPTGGSTTFDYDANYYDYFNTKGVTDQTDFEHAALVNKTAQYIISTNGTTNGTIDFSHMWATIPNGVLGSNATLAVAFRAYSSDSLNKYHNSIGYGKLNFTFQNNVTDISNTSLYCNGTLTGNSCSGTVYSAGLPLTISSPTSMPWSAYIDPSISVTNGLVYIIVTFSWQEALFNNSTQMMAGGLRIKTITDYSAPGTVAKIRTYDYGYTQDKNGDGIAEQYSYGRTLGYVSYGRYEPIASGNGNGWSFTRYSSSHTAFTSTISGNIVGYDQVAEYTVDPKGLNNGKTVYTFYNSSDTSFTFSGWRLPGVANIGSSLNGLPKSKYVYAGISSGYKKISTADYFYHSGNRVLYDCFKWFHPPNSVLNNPGGTAPCQGGSQGCYCPNNIDSATYEVVADFYPSLISEVVLQDSTIEKTYDQNDTTLYATNVTRNFYDNPAHYLLTRVSVTDSKNNNTVSYTKYPQDYGPGGNGPTGNTILDSLINKNMLATAIEKRDSLYYNSTGTGYIKSAQLSAYRLLANQSMGLDKQYRLDIASPVTNFQGFAISGNVTSMDSRYRQMISFDVYDNLGNILQYSGTDQMPLTYIWDYKNIYPIAQVKNAANTETAYTSFEADGTDNWIFADTTRNRINHITGNQSYTITTGKTISKSGLTSGKNYIVSYWSMNGPLSVNGVTATTGLVKNGWTYYQHLLPNTTTSVTITGVGITIDELRLHPDNAQMMTYTYAPLLGITTTCSVNNLIQYYVYDSLGRLKRIVDMDGNIIKTIEYSYQAQNGNF